MVTICVLLSRAFKHCIWHTGNYICCRLSHCLQMAGELFLYNQACVSGVEREGNLVARPRWRNKIEVGTPRRAPFSLLALPESPSSFLSKACHASYLQPKEQLYMQLTDLAFLCKEHISSLSHFVCSEK